MKKMKNIEKIAIITLIIVALGMVSVWLRNICQSENLENYFKDKRVLILGDSISDVNLYPDCWVSVFTERLEGVALRVDNYSRMGRTITKYEEDANNTLLDTLLEVTENYDDIIIFMGVNDYYIQSPFGEFNSSSTEELNGALNELNTWLYDNQRSAKVHIVTPLKSGRTDIINYMNPANLSMYVDCICANAVFYGWQIIDAHAFAPSINPYVNTEWYRDDTHPVDEYAPILADYIMRNIVSGASQHIQIPTYLNLTSDSTAFAFLDETGQCTLMFHDYLISGTGVVNVLKLPDSLIPEHQVTGIVYAVNDKGEYKGYPITNIGSDVVVLVGNDTVVGVINGQMGSYTFRHNSSMPLLSI